MDPGGNVGHGQCRLRMTVGLVLVVAGLFSAPMGILLYELGFCPFYDRLNDRPN